MYIPPSLRPGDSVGLVAPSSPTPEDRLAPAVEAVRRLGLNPVVYPSCRWENRHGYHAASDHQRAKDVQDAFLNPALAGVLCIRGGEGAHRMLPLLDLAAIARHPKFFSGYSDVTALHTAFNQVCGFATFHTIMPSTEYFEPIDDYSMAHLHRALFGPLPGPLLNPPDAPPMETLSPGRAQGVLCGGNLSLLAASLGTPWEIDTRGKLLFLEDIGEKPYRIDGMLTHLRNAGKLAACAGVVLGAWTNCVPDNPDRSLTLRQIFDEVIVPAGKPVLSGLACGHVLPSMSLPLGATACLDADAKTLEVLP